MLYKNGSQFKALMKAYPEYNWEIWKFAHVPKSHWDSRENRLEYFQNLGKKLKIEKWEDWYQV